MKITEEQIEVLDRMLTRRPDWQGADGVIWMAWESQRVPYQDESVPDDVSLHVTYSESKGLFSSMTSGVRHPAGRRRRGMAAILERLGDIQSLGGTLPRMSEQDRQMLLAENGVERMTGRDTLELAMRMYLSEIEDDRDVGAIFEEARQFQREWNKRVRK